MRVWVIMGGMSAEREVSLDSGRAVSQALREGGHGVEAFDLGTGCFLPEISTGGVTAPPEPPEDLTWGERLLAAARRLRGRADVAFLALHGGEGENGMVQALLESVGFPYTGSRPSACAVTMDKALTKRLMEQLGVPTPAWALLAADGGPPPSAWTPRKPIEPWPLVVKPCSEGSSVGVAIARGPGAWAEACREARGALSGARPHERQLLVEEYVPGRELTVGILDGEALPVVEIRPSTGFYDYARKYTAGETLYDVPASIPARAAEDMQAWSLDLFGAAGCRGMARVDFRLPPEGPAMCLEINTIPGMTALSLLPKAAGSAGIGFLDLIERICKVALR